MYCEKLDNILQTPPNDIEGKAEIYALLEKLKEKGKVLQVLDEKILGSLEEETEI